MAGNRIEDIGVLGRAFRRKATPLLAPDINRLRAWFAEGGKAANRAISQRACPVRLGEVKRIGWQGAIGWRRQRGFVTRLARHDPGLIIVRNLTQPLVQRFIGEMIDRDQRSGGQIVEGRVQLLVEKRHPVFDTGRTGTGADSFVNRVPALYGPEGFHETGTEARDTRLVEQDFTHRRELDRLELTQGTLGLRVKRPDGFKRVTKEVETNRLFSARRIDINHTATHGEVPRLHDGGRAGISIDREMLDEVIQIDTSAGLDGNAGAFENRARRAALRHRVYGGDDQCRGSQISRRQSCQRRCPARGHTWAGRNSVIGLAIPSRQTQEFDIGREELQSRNEGRRARIIAGNEDIHTAAEAGCVGKDERIKPFRRPTDSRLTVNGRNHFGLRHAGRRRCHRDCPCAYCLGPSPNAASASTRKPFRAVMTEVSNWGGVGCLPMIQA